jgi:hypothetical protein
MLRGVEKIYGFAVRAKDGDVGNVFLLILLIAMIVLSSWLISDSVVR